MYIGKLIIVTILLLTALTRLSAQVSASASVAATIVNPIGVTNNADSTLSAISSTNNGSVVLTQLFTDTTEKVKLSIPAGSVVSAAYAINDQGAYTYSITLPTTVSNGTNNLTVTSSTSTLAAKGKNSKPSETLNIGVILKETGNKTGGITIPITVNYN